MAGNFSDDDCSLGNGADFVDASADTEVDVRLPLGVDRDWIHFRRMPGFPRESLMRAPLTLTSRNNIDLSSRTAPDLNGPDTSCHCRTFSGLRWIDFDRGW